MKRARFWISLLTTATPLLLSATQAFARAGGGQGYHGGGGGGHGGSGGGGGGGGGDLINLLFWLLFYHPAVGVPVTLIVVAFIIYSSRSGADAYQSSVIRRGGEVIDANRRAEMLWPLMQADPAFDQQLFLSRVSVAFQKIQDAWSAQDLSNVRPFISDGVYERFNLQFAEQKALGYRNSMEDVNVDDARIAHVTSDHLFDTLAVRIEAQARDYKVSLKDGSRLSGSDASGSFAEVWSFLRRRGVASRAAGAPGLVEGHCPNCGAAIEMNQNANCAHCGALLRSGQYDWVLAEIVQESEWTADRRTDLMSVNALVARDPDFNLQDLEDRASVMFWRWQAAERTAKVDFIRKIAAPAFCDGYVAALRARSAAGRQPRRFYGECAVGSVDTLGIVHGTQWDHALVEVRWEGMLFIVNDPNSPPRNTGEATLSRTVLELARRSDVKSDAGHAISSAHCPKCGAPESGGTSNACEFCGQVLNDGTKSWVLTALRTSEEAIQMLYEARGKGAVDAPLAPPPPTAPLAPAAPSAMGVLVWMIQMALADGNLDPRERQMLAGVAQSRNISPDRLEAMIAAARGGRVDLPMPSGPREGRQWLEAMAQAAMADGNLSRDEYSLLRSAGMRLGMGEFDLQMMVKQLRRGRYVDAKVALRGPRNGDGHPS